MSRPRLADLRTLFRLEDIRMNHLEAPEDGLGLAGRPTLYAAAFRDYGIDVELGLPGRGRRPDQKARGEGALVAALDDWALQRHGQRRPRHVCWPSPMRRRASRVR